MARPVQSSPLKSEYKQKPIENITIPIIVTKITFQPKPRPNVLDKIANKGGTILIFRSTKAQVCLHFFPIFFFLRLSKDLR
jgi:hypothetical protein